MFTGSNNKESVFITAGRRRNQSAKRVVTIATSRDDGLTPHGDNVRLLRQKILRRD